MCLPEQGPPTQASLASPEAIGYRRRFWIMFLLLDANVTAGYYLPQSLRSTRAASRIAFILNSVRTRKSDHFLYFPNWRTPSHG
jgi:hypothetical protein